MSAARARRVALSSTAMPRRGQKWRAPARRGFRYVRIERVLGAVVWAREVSADGRKVYGWLHGVNRAVPIRIVLTARDGELGMPAPYELAP